MLPTGTTLAVKHIPLSNLLVEECKPRYIDMVLTYVEQLMRYPHSDAGFIRVASSKRYPGLYVVEDGHHRYCASIIAGRTEMLCIVVERPTEEVQA